MVEGTAAMDPVLTSERVQHAAERVCAGMALPGLHDIVALWAGIGLLTSKR